jgi:hypothetical protein
VSGKAGKYEIKVLFESFTEWLFWCSSNDTTSGVIDFFRNSATEMVTVITLTTLDSMGRSNLTSLTL